MKLKVHFVTPRARYTPAESTTIPILSGTQPSSAITAAFGDVKTTQEGGIIPLYKRIGTPELSTNSVSSAITTKDVSITDADGFNQHFKIAKTSLFQLDPNDVLLINHEHHYRSGVYLNDMYNAWADAAATFTTGNNPNPMFGFFIIEAVGVPATLVTTDANEKNHIGTGIGKLAFETQTRLSYVPDQTTRLNNSDVQESPVAMRIFSRRPESKTTIFNQNHATVVDATNYNLVATTSKQLKREGEGV